MVKFGSPEMFLKDHEVRFGQLINANKRFQQISAVKQEQVKDKVETKFIDDATVKGKKIIIRIHELISVK